MAAVTDVKTTIVKPATATTVRKTTRKPAKTDAQRVSKIERSMYYKGAEWDDLWTAAEDYYDLETGEIKQEGGEAILDAIAKSAKTNEACAINAASLYLELKSKLEEMKEMCQKLNRAIRETEGRMEAVKAETALFMQSVNLDRVDDGFIKVGWRSSQSVDVYDEDKLDDRFKRVKTTIEPDKIKIKEALAAGETVPGAEMKSNTTLTIRT